MEHVLANHYGSSRVVGKSFYTLKSEDEINNIIKDTLKTGKKNATEMITIKLCTKNLFI